MKSKASVIAKKAYNDRMDRFLQRGLIEDFYLKQMKQQFWNGLSIGIGIMGVIMTLLILWVNLR